MKTLSLARFPLVFAAISGALVMVASAILYVATGVEVSDTRAARDQLMAQQLAQQVAAKLEFQRLTLAQFAQAESVVDAALSGDYERRQQVTDALVRQLPYAWKIRLVSANFKSTLPDERPPVGYADLDLVNQSLAQGKAPAAVADQVGTPQARVLMVQPVFKPGEETVVGHLLLSVRYALVGELIEQLAVGGGHIQLQQPRKTGEPQLLSVKGSKPSAAGNPFVSKITGSQWQVAYWPEQAGQGGGSRLILFVVVTGLVVLLVVGLFWFLGRGLQRLVSADLATLVVMVRDARAGELKPLYPARAPDIVGTIHTVREELSGMRGPSTRPKPKAKPKSRPVAASADTPDIDLDLDMD